MCENRCHPLCSVWWLCAQSIADRLYDAQAEYIYYLRWRTVAQKDIPLKNVIDDALYRKQGGKRVIVATRTRTLFR